MNILEFTRRKTGMDNEYKNILRNEINIFLANGRTSQSLNSRYKELHDRQDRYFEEIQNMMLEFTLQERALAEISENLNVREYWGDYWE